MYGYSRRRDAGPEPFVFKGHDNALRHKGDYERLLERHVLHASEMWQYPSVPDIHPLLIRRFRDKRVLRVAWDDLLERGGRAPGPDGLLLDTYDDRRIWGYCRHIHAKLKSGEYQPGPDRIVKIPKASRKGMRTLRIQNVCDRVVGRALLLILQPVIDPGFSPFSFGFRPGVSGQGALATALTYAREHNAYHWISADIANAFDAVPFAPFIETCERHFRGDVVDVIRKIADTKRARGLRQGSPISPFLFNIYCHDHLDCPWQRLHPATPLIRFADDLLIPCTSASTAQAALRDLREITRRAGIPLKKGATHIDMLSGKGTRWLGYQIRHDGAQLSALIDEVAWFKLSDTLAEKEATVQVRYAIGGWLDFVGPCYSGEDRSAALNRLGQLIRKFGTDNCPSFETCQRWWQAANARWHRCLERARQSLDGRLEQIKSKMSLAPSVDRPFIPPEDDWT